MEIDIPGKPKLYQPFDMTAWEILGTISTDKSGRGALGRHTTTGEFAQLNVGTVKRLNGYDVRQIIGGLGRPQSPTLQ